jgi:tripartite-type tricarboxylate transporter receptor subunit TctC
MLVVNKASAAQSVDDLVRLARAAPGKLNYGVSSQTSRLLGEIFKSSTATKLMDISYKGPADVAVDLLAGRIDISFEAPGAVMPHVKAGTLKALAVMGTSRSTALPQVPTVREAGYKELELEGFIGLLAPAGTPDAILQKLSAAVAGAIAVQEVGTQLAAMGMEPRSTSPAQFAEKIASDYARLSAAIKAAGIERQ